MQNWKAMYIFLSTIILLVAVLLIFIVTIQNSKGGGLASGFSSSNQIMGVRKTTDILEKLTWGLTAVMVILCIVSIHFRPHAISMTDASIIQNEVNKASLPVPDNAQPFGNITNPQPAVAPAETKSNDSVKH